MSKFIMILRWIAYFVIITLLYVPVCVGLGYCLGRVCDKVASWLKLV